MSMTTPRHHRFEALVRALMPELYRYALWLCRQPALAEDLVQETLLRAWRALDSLRDERAARHWLITILRRELARHYERLQPEFVDADSVTLVDERRHTPEQDAEDALVRTALFRLEDDYREPLVLQVLMGCSVEEIGAIMGLQKATVLTRLFRARRRLAELLDAPAARRAGTEHT